MSKTYSTCVLTPDFRVVDIAINPGRPFPSADLDIQLAGGFPELFPDSHCILSPTLQLNKDLGDFSDETLEQIARAEQGRQNGIEVRNFSVDPSFVVCVLAADPLRLDTFLDTYGGILEIDPILVGTEHADYAQVTTVEIEPEDNTYRVSSTVRSPLNSSACTYCGACGPACPEDCISAALRFDYSRCTFCRECETSCPTNAIDIYGVEKREILTPAVILLGEVNVELPEQRRGIYREPDLPDYFSSLCSLEVEEALQCDNTICQYSPKLNSGCSLCVEACAFGAIKRDRDGVRVDSMSCVECGRCCAVCPTGAINHKRFSDAVFFEYFSDIELSGRTLVIGSSDSLHELWWQAGARTSGDCFFLEYSCPEALSLYHFLYLHSRGCDRITILHSKAADIDPGLARKVEGVNTLLTALTGTENPVGFTNRETFFAAPPKGGDESTVLKIGSSFTNRRASLAELLAGYYHHYEKDCSLDSRFGAFGTVACNEDRCTHCFACLNECKVGALQAGEDSRSLLYSTALCVGCGVCAEICPEDALRVGDQTTLGPAFGEVVELARAEPMLCKGCGKDFGTRKSFEKVMRILASRNMGDKGHLEYCDNCRVVKLFEASETDER